MTPNSYKKGEKIVAEVYLGDGMLGKKVEQIMRSSLDPRLFIEVNGIWFVEADLKYNDQLKKERGGCRT